MSDCIKCDRCGEFYDEDNASRKLRKTRRINSTSLDVWDLCPDCWESFDKWIANDNPAPEKVVSDSDVDVTTESRDNAANRPISESDDRETPETAEIGASKDEIRDFDVWSVAYEIYCAGGYVDNGNEPNPPTDGIRELLNRQASITERECRESETFRAGIVRDAVESGETVNVFGVPYVPESNYDKLKRRMESTRRAIVKAGCLFAEENGAIAVVLPPDPNKQPDDYRAAYHAACHERDEFREKLSRALDLAHEIGMIQP